MEADENGVLVPRSVTATSDCAEQSTSSIATVSLISNSMNCETPRKKKKPNERKNSITNYVDRLDDKTIKDINEALALFIYGCNIPFQVIESKYFKNLLTVLRPAYKNSIPSRKLLSTTLLDSCYQKCIELSKSTVKANSVIIIDGWKNISSNTKTVVTMIHCADGTQSFLNAWDLTLESETGEKLSEIILESIKMAKDLFNTKIYAVVSDNASPMIKMGELLEHRIWHSTCSSHTGNLLCKDVLNKSLLDRVTSILKEFRHSDYEHLLTMKGGSKITLPCEVRWCSYRDSLLCLTKNIQFMKSVAVEAKKMKESVVTLLYNTQFLEEVQETLEMLNPICSLINSCQNKTCSIADAANFWINLQLPEQYKKKFQSFLDKRKKMALNVYSLIAYFLHPQYDNDKLLNEHKQKINRFLLQNLNSTGLEELDMYHNKSGIFHLCSSKNISNPLLFWKLVEADCPNLSSLATKLLRIPAASAQIERVFSSWGYVHSLSRNRLTFERSKKLTHLYYTLRIGDIEFIRPDEDED